MRLTKRRPRRKARAPARNQTAIDMLQPGDVIVADVFGADWNFVGNKLAHYIQTTTKNGMIVDGGVYWLERIAATGMQAYYKNSFPTQGMRVMVTGINIPVRIGKTLVMPGDVVLADREGLWFIPPHMVQGGGRIRGDVEGARRLEPDDAGHREVHVPPDLRAADAGTGRRNARSTSSRRPAASPPSAISRVERGQSPFLRDRTPPQKGTVPFPLIPTAAQSSDRCVWPAGRERAPPAHT